MVGDTGWVEDDFVDERYAPTALPRLELVIIYLRRRRHPSNAHSESKLAVKICSDVSGDSLDSLAQLVTKKLSECPRGFPTLLDAQENRTVRQTEGTVGILPSNLLEHSFLGKLPK